MAEEEKKEVLTEIAKVNVQSKLGTITDNLPMVKKQIDEMFKPYMGQEVSIENLKDAKKKRAEANKIFEDIELDNN